MMKRVFLSILICMLALCAPGIADGADYVHGSNAAKAGDEYFLAVDEGDTSALVRIAGDRAYLSLRADEIGDMLAADGVMYYLRRTGDVWEIIARDAGGEWCVIAFDAGVQASDLSARDGKLFVLLDGVLHIVYPKQAICFKLVGAEMTEYVLYGDNAYFIAAGSTVEHKLANGEGDVAKISVGKLCSVNLSTGQRTVIAAEGAADIACAGGRLYFHNYADRYLTGSGADMTVEGRLYAYDIDAGTVQKIVKGYDWEYYLRSSGVVIRRAHGLVAVKGAELLYPLSASAYCGYAGDAFVWYDPAEKSFGILPDGGEAITVK